MTSFNNIYSTQDIFDFKNGSVRWAKPKNYHPSSKEAGAAVSVAAGVPAAVAGAVAGAAAGSCFAVVAAAGTFAALICHPRKSE